MKYVEYKMKTSVPVQIHGLRNARNHWFPIGFRAASAGPPKTWACHPAQQNEKDEK